MTELPRNIEVMENETVYEGPFMSVEHTTLQMEDSAVKRLDIVRDSSEVVCTLVLQADGRVLVVRQYRHAIGSYMDEIPAGHCPKGLSPDELAVHAERELREETGLKSASGLTYVKSWYSSPGWSDEKIHMFFCFGVEEMSDEEKAQDHNDPGEITEPIWEYPHVLVETCRDGKSLIALNIATTMIMMDRLAGVANDNSDQATPDRPVGVRPEQDGDQVLASDGPATTA